jgi:hypothetical protein
MRKLFSLQSQSNNLNSFIKFNKNKFSYKAKDTDQQFKLFNLIRKPVK